MSILVCVAMDLCWRISLKPVHSKCDQRNGSFRITRVLVKNEESKCHSRHSVSTLTFLWRSPVWFAYTLMFGRHYSMAVGFKLHCTSFHQLFYLGTNYLTFILVETGWNWMKYLHLNSKKPQKWNKIQMY